jgi:predicted glycoside hydrolase/deacetylase ChbG (UPF0249 family)
MTKRVRITADGLGVSREVNSIIVEMSKEGLLTHVSVVGNGQYLDDTIDKIAEFGESNIGLHFNLTNGKSLSNPKLIPLLVDEKGNFKNSFFQLVRMGLNANTAEILAEQAMIEFAKQEQKFLDKFGCLPKHLDSYQHVHIIPSIFKRLHKKEYGYIRVPLDLTPWSDIASNFSLSNFVRHTVTKYITKKACKEMGISNQPQGVCGIYNSYADQASIEKFIARYPVQEVILELDKLSTAAQKQ